MARIEGIEDPRSIKVGRALRNLEAMEPYREVLTKYPAGQVVIEEGDDPKRVHRLVARAAKESGVKVRCSWNKEKTILYWVKQTGRASAPRDVVEAA